MFMLSDDMMLESAGRIATRCPWRSSDGRADRIHGHGQTLLDTLPNLDDHRFEDGCRTMDVGSWLRSLGLGQYEAHFGTTRSTRTCCRELTDADLKDIGVSLSAIGKRLLKAIAESG